MSLPENRITGDFDQCCQVQCNALIHGAVLYEKPFMRLFLLFAAVLLITSCSRNGLDDQNTSLTGKWKLTASYISPGGATTWQDADPNNPSYVIFTPTGKITFSNKNNENTFNYTKLEEGKFSVTRTGVSVVYFYTIQGNVLTLNGGGCIEQCTTKYKRISSAF